MKTVSNEFLACKHQFYVKNQKNFILAIISQTVFSVVSIAISFLMMVTIEAIEYTDANRIKIAGILLGSILILYGVFGYLQKVYRNRFIKNGLAQFKHYIFDKLLRKSIKEFSTESSGKIINAFSNDLASIETHYLNGILQIIQQIIMFVIAMGAMYYLNWILATCVILSCAIPVVFSYLFGRHLAAKERKTSDEGESFVDQVKDLLSGFVLIKSFKSEKEILELFDRRNFSLEEAKKDRRDMNDVVTLTSTFSTILVISMIFTLGLYFAYRNIISIGAIIAFVELSHYATRPVELIFPLLSNKKAAIGLIEKVSDVIKEEEDSQEQKEIIRLDHMISMKNVSFSYNQEKEVLKSVSLKFEKGKSYAIVGGSGCGKSTLTQLLLGFYPDYEGNIAYDSVSLEEINLDSLYDMISVIQQNVFLFDSSIRNNITMFKPFSEAQIQRAIQLAGLSELIQEKGMNYECGEGGKNLSGGEKQRISIARSLLRQTQVLILDEATAALDNKTAFEVEDAILNLKDITKIVVTHKLNETILRQYDEIIVLKDGHVVEKGDYSTLIQRREYFYSLYHVTAA